MFPSTPFPMCNLCPREFLLPISPNIPRSVRPLAGSAPMGNGYRWCRPLRAQPPATALIPAGSRHRLCRGLFSGLARFCWVYPGRCPGLRLGRPVGAAETKRGYFVACGALGFFPLVPKLYLGTGWLRQLYCRFLFAQSDGATKLPGQVRSQAPAEGGNLGTRKAGRWTRGLAGLRRGCDYVSRLWSWPGRADFS